jgi:hypothetical protein
MNVQLCLSFVLGYGFAAMFEALARATGWHRRIEV